MTYTINLFKIIYVVKWDKRSFILPKKFISSIWTLYFTNSITKRHLFPIILWILISLTIIRCINPSKLGKFRYRTFLLRQLPLNNREITLASWVILVAWLIILKLFLVALIKETGSECFFLMDSWIVVLSW